MHAENNHKIQPSSLIMLLFHKLVSVTTAYACKIDTHAKNKNKQKKTQQQQQQQKPKPKPNVM